MIIVNDGSTDGSEKIIENYLKLFINIKYLAKENGGLSSARNEGLKICNGKYVGFIDSDDYIHSNYIIEFIDAIKKFEPDIIIGGRNSDINGNINLEYNIQKGFIDKYDVLNKILTWDNLDASVCDKVFKLSLFNGVYFKLGVYSEDLPVTISLIQKSDKIYHVGSIVYFYYKRDGSITSSFFSNNMISVLQSIEDVNQKISRDFLDTSKLDYFILWHYSRFYIRLNKLSKINKLIFRKQLSKFLISVSFIRICTNKHLLLRDKILMSIAKILK